MGKTFHVGPHSAWSCPMDCERVWVQRDDTWEESQKKEADMMVASVKRGPALLTRTWDGK
jgi:hypothetical protein